MISNMYLHWRQYSLKLLYQNSFSLRQKWGFKVFLFYTINWIHAYFQVTLYRVTCPIDRVSQKTWEFSDEFDIVFFLWISIVIPNCKSHNIIMSARVYFKKTINGCKDVSIMSPQDEQWRRTSLYTAICLFY